MADEKIRPAGAAPAADPQAQQKCPACGGTTRFDPVKGALVCEYCGTVTPIPAEKKEEKPLAPESFRSTNCGDASRSVDFRGSTRGSSF